MKQLGSDPAKLVFFDETWAKTKALYLPPYSPDLNPIELAFAKLKQLMRSAAHRTTDALWSDVQRMPDSITAGDAEGSFRHCGYTLQLK